MSQHEIKVGQAHIFFKKSTNFHIYRYIRFAIVTFKCYRNVEASIYEHFGASYEFLWLIFVTLLAILWFKIFCRELSNFSDQIVAEKVWPRAECYNITFLMPQCVSKMVQVSNLYLQRGEAKFQFSVSGC